MSAPARRSRYVLLSGGVGGAKLALGFAHAIDPRQLTIIVNTGDDFRHLGLDISPDLDTLMYTLAGIADPATGWGLRDDTWHCMDALDEFGGETWFRIGDRDLATHLERTRLRAGGMTLTDVTGRLCHSLGIDANVLPMADLPSPTRIDTDAGRLDFQHYFVRDRAAPAVRSVEYGGADPTPAVLSALDDPDLAAVIVAPSNPWLSIDPILACAPVRKRLQRCAAPVVAVSPIVAGRAVKGPTAKIMRELGIEVSAAAIARHYRDILNGFILDSSDRQMTAACESAGLQTATCRTIMNTLDDKIALARFTIELAESMQP